MMKRFISILIIVLIALIPSGYSLKKTDYLEARLKNVCKDLRGDALLYFVFIDSRATSPWTEFDIQSTIDSVRVAINWLHTQAKSNDVSLNIISDFYIGEEFTTITKNLPSGTVRESLSQPSMKKGTVLINTWADGIAKIAGNSLPIKEKDGLPEIQNPRNKERLVAYLRDENNVESVALFFMVNNYYKTDISVAMNTMNTEDVEFAIVSYKYPSEIAHNLLHLYGAADLYGTINRQNARKARFLESEFPDDIMQDPYGKSIWTLEIGSYTKYLIGWTDEIDYKYETYLTD